MRVDTMRKIDYFAGVPLCWLGTFLLRLQQLFVKPRKGKIKNVLLIELSEMGSTILVDPAMQKLKTQLHANLYFVIFKKNQASLFLLNTVPRENIYTIGEDGLWSLLRDTLGFLRWARQRNIDTVIDLELFSRFTALLTGFCGASRRVGFHAFHNEGLFRGEMLTHRVAYNPHIHIAKNFIALVNSLSAPVNEVPMSKTLVSDEEIQLKRLTFTEQETQFVRDKISALYADYDSEKHRIVLINPNASELLIQRRWPPANYIELMKTLLAQYSDILILITGAPGEFEEAEGLRNSVSNERCINFAGQLKLQEMPLLYSISLLMVSNDSGPGHFSAITSMRSFILFGPETPALYGSLGNSTPIYAGLACSPCVSAWNHRKTACEDNVCLQVIKPETVLETIRPVLGDTTQKTE